MAVTSGHDDHGGHGVSPGPSPSRNDGGGWGIAPAIPLVANAVVGLLWIFSVLGGWADRAFCGAPAGRDPDCVTGMNVAAGISAIPAAAALAIAVIALAVPRIRRDIDRLDLLLTVSAFLWVGAEAILFALGYLAQS